MTDLSAAANRARFESTNRTIRLLEQTTKPGDALEHLAVLHTAASELDRAVIEHVTMLREWGATWREIANALGTSERIARRRYTL